MAWLVERAHPHRHAAAVVGSRYDPDLLLGGPRPALLPFPRRNFGILRRKGRAGRTAGREARRGTAGCSPVGSLGARGRPDPTPRRGSRRRDAGPALHPAPGPGGGRGRAGRAAGKAEALGGGSGPGPGPGAELALPFARRVTAVGPNQGAGPARRCRLPRRGGPAPGQGAQASDGPAGLGPAPAGERWRAHGAAQPPWVPAAVCEAEARAVRGGARAGPAGTGRAAWTGRRRGLRGAGRGAVAPGGSRWRLGAGKRSSRGPAPLSEAEPSPTATTLCPGGGVPQRLPPRRAGRSGAGSSSPPPWAWAACPAGVGGFPPPPRERRAGRPCAPHAWAGSPPCAQRRGSGTSRVSPEAPSGERAAFGMRRGASPPACLPSPLPKPSLTSVLRQRLSVPVLRLPPPGWKGEGEQFKRGGR